jgi:hypothetical protein
MTIRDDKGRFAPQFKKQREDNTMTEVINADRADTKLVNVTREQFEQMRIAGVPLDNFRIHDPLEENRKKKLERLEDKAQEFVDSLLNFHELFDPIDIMFKLKGMAGQAVYWHYRSRRMAEQMQAKLDASGGVDAPHDTRPNGLEIDPIGNSWERIEATFRRADAENVMYLACIRAQNTLWKQNKGDPTLAERMREAAIGESITERGYSDFCNKQDQQWLRSRKEQQESSAQATAMDFATRSFV